MKPIIHSVYRFALYAQITVLFGVGLWVLAGLANANSRGIPWGEVWLNITTVFVLAVVQIWFMRKERWLGSPSRIWHMFALVAYVFIAHAFLMEAMIVGVELSALSDVQGFQMIAMTSVLFDFASLVILPSCVLLVVWSEPQTEKAEAI